MDTNRARRLNNSSHTLHALHQNAIHRQVGRMATSLQRNKRVAGPVDALLSQNQKQWIRMRIVEVNARHAGQMGEWDEFGAV